MNIADAKKPEDGSRIAVNTTRRNLGLIRKMISLFFKHNKKPLPSTDHARWALCLKLNAASIRGFLHGSS
jgi:hypothetical protein